MLSLASRMYPMGDGRVTILIGLPSMAGRLWASACPSPRILRLNYKSNASLSHQLSIVRSNSQGFLAILYQTDGHGHKLGRTRLGTCSRTGSSAWSDSKFCQSREPRIHFDHRHRNILFTHVPSCSLARVSQELGQPLVWMGRW